MAIRRLSIRRFWVLFGLALGVALAWGHDGASPALAGLPPDSPNLAIEIDRNGDTVPDCTTYQSPPADTCRAPLDPLGRVTVGAVIEAIDGLPQGYLGFRLYMTFPPDLTYAPRPRFGVFYDGQERFWFPGEYPPIFYEKPHPSQFEQQAFVGAAALPLGAPYSHELGKVMELDVSCTSIGSWDVELVHGGPEYSHLVDDQVVVRNDMNDGGVNEVLTIDCALVWDVNADGAVAVGDIGLVVSAFGRALPSLTGADVNGDGFVAVGDIGEVVAHYGQVAPPP